MCTYVSSGTEQQCNALAAEEMGTTVIWHEKEFDSKTKILDRNANNIK